MRHREPGLLSSAPPRSLTASNWEREHMAVIGGRCVLGTTCYTATDNEYQMLLSYTYSKQESERG